MKESQRRRCSKEFLRCKERTSKNFPGLVKDMSREGTESSVSLSHDGFKALQAQIH
jgi:hypothetical protein